MLSCHLQKVRVQMLQSAGLEMNFKQFKTVLKLSQRILYTCQKLSQNGDLDTKPVSGHCGLLQLHLPQQFLVVLS